MSQEVAHRLRLRDTKMSAAYSRKHANTSSVDVRFMF